jgi:hypothetical protein
MTVTIASTTDTPVEVKDAAKATKEEFQLTAEADNEAAVAKSMGDDRSSRSDGASVATADSDEAPKEASEAVSDEAVEASADEEGATVEEEDAVEASADDAEEPEAAAQKHKRRRRGRSYKDRASQLAREKAAETLRADTLAVELERLRSRQMQAPIPPPAAPKVDPERDQVADADRELSPQEAAPQEATPAAKAEGRPSQDDFESYEAFAEALVDWKLNERFTQVEARQRDGIARDRAQRAQEEVVAAHTARIDSFRGEHADFDAVITKGKDLPLSRPMQDAVVNSESGPALMYYLCQNPEECDRIAGMHPVMALKEMGKLEARVETASTGPVSSADSITKAPPPIKPVGGGATASTIPLDQMDYQTYKRTREKQIRAELEGG